MLNSSRRPSGVFGSKSQFDSHASLGPSSSRNASQRENPADKRKKEMLARLQEKWNRDQDKVREKVERGRAAREARCEQLLNNLATNDDLLSSSSAVFRAKMHQKKIQNEQLYHKWNTQVFEKIQGQIDNYLNPPDRDMAYELGKKETALKKTSKFNAIYQKGTVFCTHFDYFEDLNRISTKRFYFFDKVQNR